MIPVCLVPRLMPRKRYLFLKPQPLFQNQPPDLINVHRYTINRSSQSRQACNFIQKETLAKVFFCEFCEISKSNFFTEHLWATIIPKAHFVFFCSSIPTAAPPTFLCSPYLTSLRNMFKTTQQQFFLCVYCEKIRQIPKEKIVVDFFCLVGRQMKAFKFNEVELQHYSFFWNF